MQTLAEQPIRLYRSADAIPALAIPRLVLRTNAESLLDMRRNQVRDGNSELVPVSIDALSTAHAVLQSEDRFGKNSIESTELFTGLLQDCFRLVSEWRRKNSWEYFKPIRHTFDVKADSFYSYGLPTRAMVENALVPHPGNVEEESRRVNESVEDGTTRIIRNLGRTMLTGMGLRTISECTDKAIEDYTSDVRSGAKHRGYGGYVPEIEKLMVRDMRIDPDTGDRLQEQVGLRGTYITHQIIQIALKKRGIDKGVATKNELHGNQLVVQDDIIEFVQLLDEVASEQWCTEIFMGEEVTLDFVKDYSHVRQEASDRQNKLAEQANQIAQYTLELAAQNTDRRLAPELVENFVKNLLLRLALDDNDLAEQMFDSRTAEGLLEVNRLAAAGHTIEASELFYRVEQQAPGGGFCGAGSCGLEAATNGVDSMVAKSLGLGDGLIHDTERVCPNCKTVGMIYYDRANNKACTAPNCGSVEIQGKISRSQPIASKVGEVAISLSAEKIDMKSSIASVLRTPIAA